MQINPIRFSGLASGLDTDSIVKELMNAHRIPLVRLQQQRQLLEWQKEAYREVNRLMTNFRNAVAPLRLQSTFLAKAATVSNASVANVTAGGNANAGSYSLFVRQLAQGASAASLAELKHYSSGVVTGQRISMQTKLSEIRYVRDDGFLVESVIPVDGLTFYLNGQSFTITQDTTVAQFVADVNAKASETGVKVSFDLTTQRFYFMTTQTGKDVKIDFFQKDSAGGRVSDGDAEKDPLLTFLTEAIGIDKALLVTDVDNNTGLKILYGKNAIIDFQGATGLEFNTNNFTINGLTIQLKGTGETNITVSSDTEAIFNAIKTFVDEYNKLVDEVNKKLREPRYRDYPPLTEEQKKEMTGKEIELWEEKAKSGMIRNDAMVTGILSQLRTAIYSTVASSELKNLSAIGITTGLYSERGKLYVDEDKLRDAINTNPEAVMKLFTTRNEQDSEDGIGFKLYELAGKAIDQLSRKAGSTSSLVDNSTLGQRIKDIDERIDRMQDRLIAIEQRYWAQFTALERAIARMNMQSAWLAQTFGGGGQQS